MSVAWRGLRLVVAIVNYRTPEITIDCLASLEPEANAIGGMLAVVADNASGDGSVERIRDIVRTRGWEGWVRVVALEKNGGFAAGTNRAVETGMNDGPPEYVLYLNSDTIVERRCLVSCLELMDRDPGVGVMSCRLMNRDGTVQNAARKFPTPWRLAVGATGLPWRMPGAFGWANLEDPGWDRMTSSRDVEWLGGAFMLVRGSVLERIGGLDESFFFYGEDIEFCHRAARAGFRRRYEAGVSIVHLGGASSDDGRMGSATRSLHSWRARYLVQRKCYGRLACAFVRSIDVAECALRLAWHTVAPWRKPNRRRELRDVMGVLMRPMGLPA